MAIVKGKVLPLHDKVIVHNMHFGDQTTSGGIIIMGDDGKDRGIYPRWGQVFAKGNANTDPFEIGDWLLIEHGRWTRGIELDDGTTEEPITVRMVENKSIMLWAKTKPSDINIAETLNVPQAVDAYRLENKQ